MKALRALTGSAKARLLHELFPEEIKHLLGYMGEYCKHLLSHGEDYRKDWDNGLIGFDFWISLCRETESLLEKHGTSMLRSAKVFADQLFFRYTALFVTDCIIKSAEQQSTDEKFKLMVKVFFT